LVGSQSDECEGEDDDDLKWEPNVASDEDSDGEDNNREGENSNGKNEVMIKAQCGYRRKQVLQHVWTKETRLKIVK
jgi:hypothetical protein